MNRQIPICRKAWKRGIRLWRRFFAPPLVSELPDGLRSNANPILRLGESQRGVRILSYRSQRNKKTTELFGLGCPFIWRRLRDSNPRGFWPNGFQDFLINPTLPQNNRKYQTIENAENLDVARVFGVLSFPKSENTDGARISVSKTISKDFLEKVLDKSTPQCPVAVHIL